MKATMMSSRLPHTLRRIVITPQAGFLAASIRNTQRVTGRRSYAEAHLHERKKGHTPWYDELQVSFQC